ncbi:hypothetical protein [Dyella sp. C11]|uniref:hypothetical protein n=1 Tax=Dyella sp. C11 TaxID=2126991 RepID=UPI000D65D3FD|nr:hypothetical protein [Dyella sp. C11]
MKSQRTTFSLTSWHSQLAGGAVLLALAIVGNPLLVGEAAAATAPQNAIIQHVAAPAMPTQLEGSEIAGRADWNVDYPSQLEPVASTAQPDTASSNTASEDATDCNCDVASTKQ